MGPSDRRSAIQGASVVAGFIKVDRHLIDHPALKSKQRDSHTAFLWLVREAAIATRTIGYGKHAVRIERGQVSHSVRHLAEAWGWPRMKVHRYLKKLASEGLIVAEKVIPVCDESGTAKGTAETIIRICNYDLFSGSVEDVGQSVIPECDTTGTSNKNLRIREKKESLHRGETPHHRQPELLGAEVIVMPPNDVQIAFEAYQSVASELGLAVPRRIETKLKGGKRTYRSEIRRRLDEKDWGPDGKVGLEAWASALDALRNAKFITTTQWRGGFSLDDMVTREKLEKLLAGRYSDVWDGGRPQNHLWAETLRHREEHPEDSFFHEFDQNGALKQR
jgi:hypothetical protein